ncbi:MAG: HNH endonuclease signature motif containing protein [Thermoplasmatota archaeon]
MPRADGGPTVLENLVLLCRPCHDRVHAHRPRDAERVRARVRAFLAGRTTRWAFPPPPAPLSAEESVRLFLYRVAARETRHYVGLRRAANPPFDPMWPVARLLSPSVSPRAF